MDKIAFKNLATGMIDYVDLSLWKIRSDLKRGVCVTMIIMTVWETIMAWTLLFMMAWATANRNRERSK